MFNTVFAVIMQIPSSIFFDSLKVPKGYPFNLITVDVSIWDNYYQSFHNNDG